MARTGKIDAIEKFRFTVAFTGLGRAGFSEVSIPKYTITKGEYREGNAPDNVQLFPGLTRTEDVVLSRGSTTSQDLYEWLRLVFDPEKLPNGLPQAGQGQNQVPLGNTDDYRKEVTVTLFRRNGVPAKQWVLRNAFPIAFQPGSDLNANEDGEKSIEQITLAYETFEEISGVEISAPLAGENQE